MADEKAEAYFQVVIVFTIGRHRASYGTIWQHIGQGLRPWAPGSHIMAAYDSI